MSQFFTSGGLNIGASASASVLPMNIWGWFPLGLTGLISLQSKGLSRVFSSTTIWRRSSLPTFFFFKPFLLSNSHIQSYGKTIALTIWNFAGKVKSLLLNMLCSFVIISLPRNKSLFISWLQSPSAVILEPKKIKSVTVSIVFPSICHEVQMPIPGYISEVKQGHNMTGSVFLI